MSDPANSNNGVDMKAAIEALARQGLVVVKMTELDALKAASSDATTRFVSTLRGEIAPMIREVLTAGLASLLASIVRRRTRKAGALDVTVDALTQKRATRFVDRMMR